MHTALALSESVGWRTGFGPRTAESNERHAEANRRMESELIRLADGLLKKLESDRTRVAAVLDDEALSMLTMARYLIEDARHRLTRGEINEISEALQNASGRLREVGQQLAALSSELRPRLLDDLGLLPALASYLRDFSRDHRAIFISPRITVPEKDIPANLKLPVFRIVQAALTNVARHSKASSARVSLSLLEDELRVAIEDDGVGFDAERWRRHIGPDCCGLGMICRWAEASGGCCTIEAGSRHGARVRALWRVPSVLPTARSEERADPTAFSVQQRTSEPR